MGLQDRLDEQKKQFESSVPARAVEVMHRATEDLRKSGMLERAARVGEKAPDFVLNDAFGKTVQLTERLHQGPVVLGFYRGRW